MSCSAPRWPGSAWPADSPSLEEGRGQAYKQSRIPSEGACQEEQNGTNFSYIAPSSEELWARKGFDQNALWMQKMISAVSRS